MLDFLCQLGLQGLLSLIYREGDGCFQRFYDFLKVTYIISAKCHLIFPKDVDVFTVLPCFSFSLLMFGVFLVWEERGQVLEQT